MSFVEPTPPVNAEVAHVFSDQPNETRVNMLRLRQLIFDTAARKPHIGAVIESLKWGQASYSTKPKTGSPLRIAPAGQGQAHDYELLVVCQTSLIADFNTFFPGLFDTEGNRVVRFRNDQPWHEDELSVCIEHAQTLYSERTRTGL